MLVSRESLISPNISAKVNLSAKPFQPVYQGHRWVGFMKQLPKNPVTLPLKKIIKLSYCTVHGNISFSFFCFVENGNKNILLIYSLEQFNQQRLADAEWNTKNTSSAHVSQNSVINSEINQEFLCKTLHITFSHKGANPVNSST